MRASMSSVLFAGLGGLLVAGCNGNKDPECTEWEEVFVWADGDGDGFGRDEVIGYVCTPVAGQATNNADCDDQEASVHPGAEEVCDLLDNDCNGRVDEVFPKVPWYRDDDGDGFGSLADFEFACESPGTGYLVVSGDCNDNDPAINAGAREVCNGIDDDCDGLEDDADGGIDPTTYFRWHEDNDGDGFGSAIEYIDRCNGPNGFVLDGSDCDDTRQTVKPGASEVCNERDDDCNGLTDDEDPNVDPATQQLYPSDADNDGYGDPNSMSLHCEPVTNTLDCDDSDNAANIAQGWHRDNDSDGYGVGPELVFQCLNPGGGLAPANRGVDCDDNAASVHPDAIDPCGDGTDQDCSGSDLCESCKVWQDSAFGLGSGVYSIEPVVGQPQDVWCDMTTDGGGWTLVASTRTTTLNDEGTSLYYADLATLVPTLGHTAVWNGLRGVVETRSDIRFACKINATAANMDVDLSFYDVQWYMEITTGTDAQSCFSEIGQPDPPPKRRDNIANVTLLAGNQWTAGALVGEDSCTDTSDFTVDFDDRGMDSNQTDGTDWGEDDGSAKCGTTTGQSWFIFIREF